LEKTVDLSYYSGDQLKANSREGKVACMGEKINAYKIVVRKPE
jgi:hypothetical protein